MPYAEPAYTMETHNFHVDNGYFLHFSYDPRAQCYRYFDETLIDSNPLYTKNIKGKPLKHKLEKWGRILILLRKRNVKIKRFMKV